MAESTEQSASENLPVAAVSRRALSLIWLVPVVAALIGGWLIFKTVTETGPTVTISFRSGEGLQPGKTKIRYKDVEIGKVEEVRLSKDLSRVVVTARLVKEAEDYLREDTQFWIVRARVAATEVTGLSTLFSGAYIGAYPGTSKVSAREFQGLEEAPLVMKGVPGRQFVLKAESLGSLYVGAPVYSRQIRVGQVLGYEFAPGENGLLIKVFIEAPFDTHVRSNTRFWNASGLDVTLGAGGVEVRADSLVSILIGGVAFATPGGILAGTPVEAGAQFHLYQNPEGIKTPSYTHKMPLLLYFDQSVRGLATGSPVELRGLPIGRVLQVSLDYDLARQSLRIPVRIEIEPERIRLLNQNGMDYVEMLEQLVEQGLRAQLKTGNLVTGQAIIDLDLHLHAAAQKLVKAGDELILPTLSSSRAEGMDNLASLAKKLDAVPYAQISVDIRQSLEEFRATLAETRKLVAGVDREVVPGTAATLQQAQQAMLQLQQVLERTEQALDPEAPLSRETSEAMRELSRAARSLRVLTDYLEQHPESLLRGR